MSNFKFIAGDKHQAIVAVLTTLYQGYETHSCSLIQRLILRNASLSHDTQQNGFWYKQNRYRWNAWIPDYLIQIPLHAELHTEMEELYEEERVVGIEKQRVNEWLCNALNYCENPTDVKRTIPEHVYSLMPDCVKENTYFPHQSALNQSYLLKEDKANAEFCVEAITVRIMMNSLLGD